MDRAAVWRDVFGGLLIAGALASTRVDTRVRSPRQSRPACGAFVPREDTLAARSTPFRDGKEVLSRRRR